MSDTHSSVSDTHSSPDQKRWLRRVIEDETHSAWLLLIAAASGLALAQLLPSLPGFLTETHISVLGLSLTHFAADGLLAVFFFVAGLELRHELTVGSLNSVRQAAVPLVAAAAGMLVPASLFLLIGSSDLDVAWGVPMATDLPIALVLVAAFGKHLPLSLRAFLLSLAIADDAGSVLIVAAAFGSSLHATALAAAVLAFVVYWQANRRELPGVNQLFIAMAAWWAMVETGLHPTLAGLILGLITVKRGDSFREIWQPISSVVCVPLFVFTALAIPVNFGSVSNEAISAVMVARIVGKPLGIALGVALALTLFRPAVRLPWSLYLVAGVVASAGFSVSLLFAQLSISSETLLAQLQIAVIVSLIVSAALSAVVLKLVRPT